MVQFNDWCITTNAVVGDHNLCLLTGEIDKLATGIGETAVVVPGHYAAEEQVSRALARLGKTAAAALIQGKLPTTKGIRSGDLGEIYATEWIDAHCGGYLAPIKRLRWKDHRNMAMRGDDVIAINVDPESQRLSRLTENWRLRAWSDSLMDLTGQVLRERPTGQHKDRQGDFGTRACLYFAPGSCRFTTRLQLPLADRGRCLLSPVEIRGSSLVDDAMLPSGWFQCALGAAWALFRMFLVSYFGGWASD